LTDSNRNGLSTGEAISIVRGLFAAELVDAKGGLMAFVGASAELCFQRFVVFVAEAATAFGVA
jgi:hypothetical protein